jgi:hypothetical protein
MATKLKSDVKLGDRYRDPLTGFEGVATAVTFYLHACERVSLEFIKDGEVKYEAFDAPRLIHVDTDTRPATTRTGGPGGREARPNATPTR